VVVSEGAPLYYTVKKGDTISSIAERHKVSQAQLRELNQLSGNNIRAGQKLLVGTGPASSTQTASSQASLTDYTVVAGDTLSVVAERFGMRTAELRSVNRLSGDTIRQGQKLKVKAPVSASSSSASASGGEGIYTVASGDTLSVVAERHQLRTAELLALNDLNADSVIRPGQKLIVRKGAEVEARASSGEGTGPSASSASRSQEGSYTVQSGDTLSTIAEKVGMRTQALRDLNSLKGDSIRPGQSLKILTPVRSTVSESSQSAQSSQSSQSARAAQSSQSSPSSPSSSSSSGASGSYTVQSGDTLSTIAE
jgi:LysM repeat protein